MRQLRVESARDLGPQFVNNTYQMVGQDGAYSIPLGGGEALWFFGDTLIGKRVPGKSLWYPDGKPVGPKDMSGLGSLEKMINNTGLLLAEKTGRYGLRNYDYICDHKGLLKNLIPLHPEEDPDEVRVWCLHGVALGNKLYLFFIKVHMLDSGSLPVNFEIVGSGIAVGSKSVWEFKRIETQSTDLFWGREDPQFGSAVLKMNDWLYLYGVRKDETGVQKCYVSRVKPDAIESRANYEFLVSGLPEWNSDINDAISIYGGVPNEQSVSFNEFLGCYLAVHSLDLSGKIVARTAENPWGPWSEPEALWQVNPAHPQELPYPQLIYAGKEHPELAEDNGRIIYVTYVEFEEYFPHLVEISLS